MKQRRRQARPAPSGPAASRRRRKCPRLVKLSSPTIVYGQTIKGSKFNAIAAELEKHASEELDHAIQITKQIDYFNGTPITTPNPVKLSDKPEDMLSFDLENERVTIIACRERIRQAEAMGEFALSEVLRRITAQEQEHLTDLADALGIDNPVING